MIKQQSPQNNPEESYTEGKAIHEACGYLIKLVRTYDSDKNAYSFYRGKDCIKKLCKDLRDQEMEIFNYEKKKEMMPLTDDEKRKYEKKGIVTYVKENFVMMKMKKINLKYTKKLEITIIIEENLEELLIAFVI